MYRCIRVSGGHKLLKNTIRVNQMTNHCEYCGTPFAPTGPFLRTKEHLMPKSMGGTLTIPVCYRCNQERKSSMTYPRFLRFVHSHEKQWNDAVRDTTVSKFKRYIGEHPDDLVLPIVRQAMIVLGVTTSSAATTAREVRTV